MATQPSFVEYVAEQAALGDRLTAKRMFGEYGLYIDGKVVAFACDDSLFVKPTAATETLTAALPRRPPYPGAKGYPVADELLDDSDALRRLLLATFEGVPVAKAKPASKRAKATEAQGALTTKKAAKATTKKVAKVVTKKAAKAATKTAAKAAAKKHAAPATNKA